MLFEQCVVISNDRNGSKGFAGAIAFQVSTVQYSTVQCSAIRRGSDPRVSESRNQRQSNPQSLGIMQGLIQIFHDILHIFDAHRDAN